MNLITVGRANFVLTQLAMTANDGISSNDVTRFAMRAMGEDSIMNPLADASARDAVPR